MLSAYWCNKVLRTMYIDTQTTFYIGLSGRVPDADGSGVREPAGNSYARVPIVFTEPEDGMISNAENINFPACLDDWFPAAAKAVCYVVFDGPGPDANVLGAGEFFSPIEMTENYRMVINSGFLRITLAGHAAV